MKIYVKKLNMKHPKENIILELDDAVSQYAQYVYECRKDGKKTWKSFTYWLES